MTLNQFVDEVIAAKNFDVPVQEKIKQSNFPIVVWGAGSLSFSLKDFLDIHGIRIECYRADGISETTFRDGIPILPREEVFKRFEKFNVIFGHSKYELKKYLRENFPAIQEIFCITNLSYNRFQGMSPEFFKKHSEEYFNVGKMFEDEISRQCFPAWLKTDISGDADYIIEIPEKYRSVGYFDEGTTDPGDDEIYIDVGAYTGDSIEMFLKAVNGNYKKIYAFEPDSMNFPKLRRYVEENNLSNIILKREGLWNEETYLHLTDSGDQLSSVVSEENLKTGRGGGEIKVNSLDNVLNGEKATLIKINMLFGAKEIIEGMKNTLQKHKPKIVMTIGFDEHMLLDILPLIKKFNRSYKLHMRFASAMSERAILIAD